MRENCDCSITVNVHRVSDCSLTYGESDTNRRAVNVSRMVQPQRHTYNEGSMWRPAVAVSRAIQRQPYRLTMSADFSTDYSERCKHSVRIH